jgi:hypothetical protein
MFLRRSGITTHVNVTHRCAQLQLVRQRRQRPAAARRAALLLLLRARGKGARQRARVERWCWQRARRVFLPGLARTDDGTTKSRQRVNG